MGLPPIRICNFANAQEQIATTNTPANCKPAPSQLESHATVLLVLDAIFPFLATKGPNTRSRCCGIMRGILQVQKYGSKVAFQPAARKGPDGLRHSPTL